MATEGCGCGHVKPEVGVDGIGRERLGKGDKGKRRSLQMRESQKFWLLSLGFLSPKSDGHDLKS